MGWSELALFPRICGWVPGWAARTCPCPPTPTVQRSVADGQMVDPFQLPSKDRRTEPIGDTGISRPDSTAARPPPDPSGRTPPAVPKLGAQRPVQQLGGRRQRVSFRSPSTISSGRPEIRSRDVPHRRGGHPPAVSVRGGRSSAPTARPITPIGQLNGRDADALQDPATRSQRLGRR